MADNKYQVFLDFMTDIKLDKSKVDKYAKDLTESLKKAKPGVEIDESKVKKSIEDIMDSIGSLSKAAKNVDMSINADDAKKALADIEKMMA
jgi:hypothetical protein